MTNSRPCPSCKRPKSPLHYLCRDCWFTLTPAARRALNRHDRQAFGRLRELYGQLSAGVPLAEIGITP